MYTRFAWFDGKSVNDPDPVCAHSFHGLMESPSTTQTLCVHKEYDPWFHGKSVVNPDHVCTYSVHGLMGSLSAIKTLCVATGPHGLMECPSWTQSLRVHTVFMV